jgi:Ca2+-binding RTX toxin-like protein
VPEEVLGQYAISQGVIAEKGQIEADSESHYTYKPGRGTVSFNPGDPQTTLKMENLQTPDDLSVYRIDDDMHLAVKGATGEIKIPGWFSGGGNISAVELSDGRMIAASYLEENAIIKEPDIDITPVSVDKRIVPDSGQIEVVGGKDNDYIFGNSQNNTLYGKEGSNIYYYRLGEGNDTIMNEKDGIAVNVLRFHMDITSKDIEISRAGDDLQFALAGGGVTVKGWYENDTAKLDRVEIYDGTYWDVRDLEKLADGKTLLPRGHALNPMVIEANNTNTGEENQGSGCYAASVGWVLLLVLPLFYRHTSRRR